jgi:hypothetical protein
MSSKQPLIAFNQLNEVGKAYAYWSDCQYLLAEIERKDEALRKIAEFVCEEYVCCGKKLAKDAQAALSPKSE